VIQFQLEKLQLPLNLTWKISRNSTDEKTNFVVKAIGTGAMKGMIGYGEVAFNVRYGESLEGTEKAFEQFRQLWNPEYHTMEQFHHVADECEGLPMSLRCGLECATIEILSKFVGKDIPTFLRVKKLNRLPTSFSLPIMENEAIADFVQSRNLSRFPVLKIKIDAKDPHGAIQNLIKVYNGPIRVDANEAFPRAKDFLEFEKALGNIPIQFFEQPLPGSEIDGYLELKAKCRTPIFADESVTKEEIPENFPSMFHGVNIKIMKSGGIYRALGQLRQARSMGLKTMLGCMVETSLGISWAMYLGQFADYFDLDGHLFLKHDPFKRIEEDQGHLIWGGLH